MSILTSPALRWARASYMPRRVLPARVAIYLPGQDDPQSSTIRDRSGNGSNGTITGALWQRESKGMWSLYFDGSDNKVIATGTWTPTSDFYFKAWYKPDTGYGEHTASKIFMKDVGELHVDTNDGHISYQVLDDTPASILAEDDAALTVGTWYMLVGTFNDTDDKARLYKNESGVMALVATSSALVSGTLFDASGTDWQMGNVAATTRAIKGNIALCEVGDGLLTLGYINDWFQQERHLFGV